MQKLLASLSLRQRITIVIAALAAGGGLYALVHWHRESDFRPLFTAMAADDAGAVVQQLKEGGVPYRLSENGSTVLVPSPVSLFGAWNWKLPDLVARILRIPPSVVHAEKPEIAVGD